jgi:hypothetical protein
MRFCLPAISIVTSGLRLASWLDLFAGCRHLGLRLQSVLRQDPPEGEVASKQLSRNRFHLGDLARSFVEL